MSYCNVTIAYTHTGEDDSVNVQIMLPISPAWNGKFQGIGGGGFAAGLMDPGSVPDAVSQGYAVGQTDAGHDPNADTDTWGLLSRGNPNLYLLQDFAGRSLNDMTLLGKQVAATFYGSEVQKSYWNGCSTGGRQGLYLAQTYPDLYDGILAQSPAINWNPFTMTQFYPQVVMKDIDYYPPACELQALTAAAIDACDGLDGLVDGVIGAPGLCKFDPQSVVGQSYTCSNGGTNGTITSKGATVISKVWQGSRSVNGSFEWHGYGPDADATHTAGTACYSNGTCYGVPQSTSHDWIQCFLLKDADSDPSTITHAQFDTLFIQSIKEYWDVIESGDPDLSGFKAHGGKMITWHGMADPGIMFNNTVDYYQRVLGVDSNARDYYRFYMAPGVGHCGGGSGAVPNDPFDVLVAWVENGTVPETLAASHTVNGTEWDRDLCQYPKLSLYTGGDPADASSYVCQ